MIFPWFFWGGCVWIYEVIRKGIVYFPNPIKWIFGVGTYLWYMSIVMAFWIFFHFVKSYKIKIFLFIFSILYRIFAWEICNINIQETHWLIIINNFCGWMFFFETGLLLQEKRLRNKVKTIINEKKKIIIISCLFTLFILCYVLGYDWKYTSRFYILFMLCIGLSIYIFVDSLNNETIKKLLVSLGENSFFIYLTHMPLAGLISYFFSVNKYTACLVLFEPIIVVFIMYWVCELCRCIIGRNKILSIVFGTNKR